MFNTRCVSIIPLMAARQSAKHISKVWKRRFQEKQLCVREGEKVSHPEEQLMFLFILRDSQVCDSQTFYFESVVLSGGFESLNLKLSHFIAFVKSYSNTKMIVLFFLVRPWTQVRPSG